jgi:hypothetical protein
MASSSAFSTTSAIRFCTSSATAVTTVRATFSAAAAACAALSAAASTFPSLAGLLLVNSGQTLSLLLIVTSESVSFHQKSCYIQQRFK